MMSLSSLLAETLFTFCRCVVVAVEAREVPGVAVDDVIPVPVGGDGCGDVGTTLPPLLLVVVMTG